MLWVLISIRAWCTTLCDKCQWLATGQWFSPGTLVSSTNKTDRHEITEILLKVASHFCYNLSYNQVSCEDKNTYRSVIFFSYTGYSITYLLSEESFPWHQRSFCPWPTTHHNASTKECQDVKIHGNHTRSVSKRTCFTRCIVYVRSHSDIALTTENKIKYICSLIFKNLS